MPEVSLVMLRIPVRIPLIGAIDRSEHFQIASEDQRDGHVNNPAELARLNSKEPLFGGSGIPAELK
jgi:hypothetical protein